MAEHNGDCSPEEEARREKKREKMRRYRANRAAREEQTGEPIAQGQEIAQGQFLTQATSEHWEEFNNAFRQLAEEHPRIALGFLGVGILGFIAVNLFKHR